jgi:hypothetical protein
MKRLLLIPVALLSACGSAAPTTMPSVEPVGEGLKVIGFAIVGAAVLGVIAKFIR